MAEKAFEYLKVGNENPVAYLTDKTISYVTKKDKSGHFIAAILKLAN